MLSRRDMASMLAATSLVGAAAAASPAVAQSSSVESTFDRVRRTKKLKIGAVNGGAPYYQRGLATGQWRGFYIDICKALADDLECDMELVETTWGNSVLDLQAGKTDVFFGLNPTPKRALVIDFSVPVFSNAFSFITKKGFDKKTWAELNQPEVRIAVDAGSSHDQIVSRLAPKAQITRLGSADDATAALQAGRVDAQCLVFILALTVLKKNASLGQFLLPTPVVSTTSNAGFRREPDKTFRDYVNAWIDFNRGTGFIRQTIISNMELVGVQETDFPTGVTI